MFSKCHLLFKTIEKREIQGTLLLTDPRNSSSSKFVNSRKSDYNRHTDLPFVYQSTSLEYHEPIEYWGVEDNYDPNILEWANVNCLRIFMYDDAQVNVLEEALPFQMNMCKKRNK
jgi:hypothetical protein